MKQLQRMQPDFGCRLDYLTDEMCQPHCHWQTRMVSLTPSPSPSPKASPDKDDKDDKDGASSSGDDEMTISQ